MSYIQKADIPKAYIAPDALMYAGAGWLALVREALAVIDSSEIVAIREDSGALRIELACSTPEQRYALTEIAKRSLAVCEICGDAGELRFDGLKNGHPAGWHRVRCEAHANTKTYGDELLTREKRRRRALWQIAPLRDPAEVPGALAELRSILAMDQATPIGPAAGWTIDQLLAAVPVHADANPRYVCPSEIPEPWRTRFEIASSGSTRFAKGFYADDWANFLYLWQKEHTALTDRLLDLDEPSENLLIIDFEATCEDPTPEGYHFQIIEIGAVWASHNGEILDTFETLVRADQPISEFCTAITTITQVQSDSGLSFPEASAALAEFASRYPSKTWASWGAGDLKMIERDSAYHGVKNPLDDWAHRNLKLEYHDAKPKMKKKQPHVGMKRAMIELGIEQEGAHHRALPDALNIAKVFSEMQSRVRLNRWGEPQ
ncbi:exonuclease domain-containing protein [Pseudomonas sp. SA3-5]|uniref:Exonuclease domain-containing protein n=1 Tax=Pseudomonas aestuarii TaxID=3018340 RepID=A0ABT4XHH0_9PSED|nr:3'-5' exonuclease [Pseudomonas aestuarii]MDA7087670.1 exonuclease domain-containing protein [Pseudomonas aestuarii]